MKKNSLFFVLLTLLLNSSVNAQKNKADSAKSDKKSSYFKLATSYLTNAVYNGRKDSVTLPYITPSLGYYDKSGFYISGALSYLSSSSNSRIDLFSLTTGYDFNLSDKVSSGIYASKDFYNNTSTAVRSETTGSLGGNISYDPGFISVNGGINVLFSSQTDVSLDGSVAHSFSLGEEGNEWNITPTVAVNLGTQNYYQDYFQNRGKKKNGNSGTVQVQQNKFGILDYELSLPVSYDATKWGLYLTPTYAIPQNPISVTAPGGNTFVSQKLENVFYAQFGVYIKF